MQGTHRHRKPQSATHPLRRLWQTGRRLMAHSRRSHAWLRIAALVAVLLPTGMVGGGVASAQALLPAEELILAGGETAGIHYRQTGAGTGLGYDVREPFLSRFTHLGGPPAAGYPVSAPFWGSDGCLYQAFQVTLLQRCGDLPVRLANTFQILEEAGADDRLELLGIGRGETDSATSFADAVRIRLTWLEDAAIRERYLSQCGNGDSEAAIQFCGLPMNRPRLFGPFVSQRFQRIAFQRWLTDGPGGIRAGDVTAVLGGDLLKETGVLSGPVVAPHPLGEPPVLTIVSFLRGLVGSPPGRATPTPTAVAVPASAAGQRAVASQQGAQRTTPLSYGFQADFFNTGKRPQAISLIKDAGFGWAKQQVIWSQYEISLEQCNANRANCLEQPVNGRPKYFKRDWLSFLDAVVDDVSASGLNLLLSIVRSPDFYAVPGGHAPSNPEMLKDFLQFLAGRYRGKVKAIEPWNEQNLAWEWGGDRLWPNRPASPPQGAVDFVSLQKAAYQGIKAADPAIIVVLPALTPTGLAECWLDPGARTQGFCLDAMKTAIDDRLYLDFVFQVNNGEIKQYYDVLGVHPSGYNNPPDDWVDKQTVPIGSGFKGHGSFYIKRYQQLREVQLKYGDTKPMWFTEVGWSATTQPVPGYEYGQDNSEPTRGKYFARLLEQVEREAPYVTNVIIWNLNFRTLVGPTDEKYGFGVVNPDGSPTPAYLCLQDFVRSGNRITRAECRP